MWPKNFLKGRYQIPGSKPVIPGRCGNFGELFSEVLKINQIPHAKIAVVPNGIYKNKTYTHMLIKKWSYNKIGTYADSKAKWQLRLNKYTMVPKQDSYGDLQSLPGISGQNSPTPSEKVFDNHAIVEIPRVAGDKYFDPSYGRTYENEFDFEKEAVSGYATEAGFDDYTYLFLVIRPDGKGELQFQKYE